MRTARVSLGWVVSALTVSVLAPLAVMSVLSIQRTWRAELANLQQQNVATVRAVSDGVARLPCVASRARHSRPCRVGPPRAPAPGAPARLGDDRPGRRHRPRARR